MAATTKKKRKREKAKEEDTPYQSKKKLIIGSKVEVRSVEEGFAGSWHCGTVISWWHLCRVVEYDHYFDDEGLESLKETVHVSPLLEGILLRKGFNYRGIIRPVPPPCKIETSSLNFGLCVDVFMDDAWWEGVIFDHKHAFLERLVFLPDLGNQQMMKIDDLRVTQDWDEVEECWTVRGNWKFLELIEEVPTIVHSATQIWYYLRQKERFVNGIKEWTCNDKSMWVDLIVETVSEYLDISSKLVYKVISEKVGNYLVNDEPKKTTRSRKRNPAVSKFLKRSEEEGVSKDDHKEGTQLALPAVFVENLSKEDEDGPISCKRERVKINDSTHIVSNDIVEKSGANRWSFCDEEIDDDAQEARSTVVDSDNVIVCTRYTAYGENGVQDVGTAVDDTVYGSLSDGDDEFNYKELSLKSSSHRGMRPRKKRIQAPTDSESKGPRWLPLGPDFLPGAKCYPEALKIYLKARGGSNKESADLRLKCRMHLSYMGWRIEYRRTGSKGVIFRYTPPKGEPPLFSFRRACQEALSAGLHQQVHLLSICLKGQDCASAPLCPEPESLDTPSKGGKPLHSIRHGCKNAMSSNHCQQVPISRIHRKDPLPCLAHETLYSNTSESRKTPIILGESDIQPNSECKTLVPCSSKGAQQVAVSSSAHHTPGTILSWLIENNVVLPRAKVRYMSARDESIIGHGKINQNEIKCNCCQEVFSLYKDQNTSPNHLEMDGLAKEMVGGNLTAENDEEEVAEESDSESEGENLGGFMLKKSGISDCGDSFSNSNDAVNKLDTGHVIRRSRNTELKWQTEEDMLSSFEKDHVLCMEAVCALHRQQTDDGSITGSLNYNDRRFSCFSTFVAHRGNEIAGFLTNYNPKGDLEKSVEELDMFMPEGLEDCKSIATFYSNQVFMIYQNKEDPFFGPS